MAETMEKVSVFTGDGIGSSQRSNSVESPGGSTRKGFGLKKWRRIKRDGHVKEEAAPVDDGSKLLKRGLTGLVNTPCKHVEARQSSEGSVGSVNMVVANGFSPDSGFMFNVGQGFEKSEEHRGGKIVSGSRGKDSIKNGSEEQERKHCSSIDSDMRSSDFVFSSGAVSVGEKDERLIMNHTGEYNKDKDQITDSIRDLAALQEALWKEVTSIQEIGKESIPSNGEENSTSSGSQVLILKQKVKHLQHKLEDIRADLDAKETRIQELENSKIESELEGVFKRKIEAEIEHLLLTRSLHSSLQVLKEQPKKVHSLAEDPEPNRGKILRTTCKSSLCFLTQLILLVCVLRLLLLQSSPASLLVIPT